MRCSDVRLTAGSRCHGESHLAAGRCTTIRGGRVHICIYANEAAYRLGDGMSRVVGIVSKFFLFLIHFVLNKSTGSVCATRPKFFGKKNCRSRDGLAGSFDYDDKPENEEGRVRAIKLGGCGQSCLMPAQGEGIGHVISGSQTFKRPTRSTDGSKLQSHFFIHRKC